MILIILSILRQVYVVVTFNKFDFVKLGKSLSFSSSSSDVSHVFNDAYSNADCIGDELWMQYIVVHIPRRVS